ncbi:MAG: ABC transporter permease [Ignavibacteriales bacterium]|nr:MAG: ABC transporter permease [Ignavibacteriales bacterium]
MSLPLFVAKKYISSGRESRFISLISTISVFGITLGVAALIIALSILNGFEQTITKKITDFESHIKISSYSNILPDYKKMRNVLKEKIEPYSEEVIPYVLKLAIVGSKHTKDGVNIKGIEFQNTSSSKLNVVEGEKDLNSLNDSSIIIGKRLATKLLISPGDYVNIFALKNDELPSAENLPNIKRYKVASIFESGMAEYDDLYAYVNLSSAQDLFNLGDNVNGYDIKVNDVTKIDSLTSYLANDLRYPHSVRSIFQIHRNIFTWIDLQKEPIPIILGLITLVAVFNIIGTLLMIVLEKTSAVGVLKSMGSTKKQIISVFLLQGLFLASIGIIAGNILSYVFLSLQLKYNIITIPSSVYFMSSVPIYLSPDIFLLVSGITLALSLAACILPSYVATKIQPVNSIRFS